MLYPIKNREDLEKLEDLVSLNNRVDEPSRLRDNRGKPNFHENKIIHLTHLLIQLKKPLKI